MKKMCSFEDIRKGYHNGSLFCVESYDRILLTLFEYLNIFYIDVTIFMIYNTKIILSIKLSRA